MDVDMAAPGLERLIEPAPPLDQIASGIIFGEGPVWDRRKKQLFWTDIIGDKIWTWKPGIGSEVVLHPSQHANGMTFDREGRLVIAGWGKRTVWRLERDGSLTTLASHYESKKLNSPNDIVVRSDGTIYWTDSPGGLVIPGMVGDDLQRYLDMQGVFRLSRNGTVHLAIDDCVYPNGLAFTPDEKQLYVNDSRQALIRVFDVRADGSLGPGRLFHKLAGDEAGVADGMKVDIEGNVYCTGPGGIHIINPKGKLLGRLKVPGHTTNLCWGDDDWRSLFYTTYHGVYRTRVKTSGVAVW